MVRLLIIADDDIGPVMAGPGMRFVRFAQLLAPVANVTMAVPHAVDWQPGGWQIVPYSRDGGEIDALVETHEVILTKGLAQFHFPVLQRPDRILICDLYDPFMFENLEAHIDDVATDAAYMYQFNLELVVAQLRRGDFFICANERQRDLWIGMLTALGRVNQATYATDRTLRQLIDVVPFGLEAQPPTSSGPVMKGVWPGVAASDQVVLWGGGVWPWLDVTTPLEAMALLAESHPAIKFCFLGKARPATSWYTSPEAFAEMQTSVEGIAERLGVLGRNVFFNDRWVPLDERGAYLLESDAGIISHTLNLETHYSARTRALDYLWAGLPIVTTTGDTVAEWVERYALGSVVPPRDPAAFAAGIVAALAQPRAAVAERMAPLRAALVWERAIAPLVAFCGNPQFAPDHSPELAAQMEAGLAASVTHRDTVIRDLEAAIRARDVEIGERKAWLAQLEQALAGRDVEIGERKAWLAQLEQALAERDMQVAQLQAEQATAQAKITELATEQQRWISRYGRLNGALEWLANQTVRRSKRRSGGTT